MGNNQVSKFFCKQNYDGPKLTLLSCALVYVKTEPITLLGLETESLKKLLKISQNQAKTSKKKDLGKFYFIDIEHWATSALLSLRCVRLKSQKSENKTYTGTIGNFFTTFNSISPLGASKRSNFSPLRLNNKRH